MSASMSSAALPTLAEAGRKIAAGELSPVALTEAALARAAALQPKLDAFIEITAERARAAARLREAVAAAPLMVAGTGRLDTRVMSHFGKRVFCKVGAEGVYCAALPELGLGIALKMDDGNTARAAEVAVVALIESLLELDDADRAFVAPLRDVEFRNWNGRLVGRLAASPAFGTSMH
jgi:L-asparaginase II